MIKKDIIILAAGVGSRLRPLTDEVPKTMVEVNGEAIIERLLKQIEAIDSISTNIKIASGYKSQILKNFVHSLDLKSNIEFIENPDYDTTNNMYSLYLALSTLNEKNDLVIINADCFYDKYIVENIIKSNGNYIAIDKGIFNEESMKIKTDGTDRVIGMSKAFKEDNNVYVSIDIYTFDSKNRDKIFQISSNIINGGELNSWTEVAIDLLSKDESSNINYLDMTGRKWMEIDNHEDLRKAEKIFN
ncbi:phosphocholine cytidylyltransferase family protein [Arenibacter sp. TNZ]|jgi:choline kinase|uniref:phosphocholine cytidylyltransferase family protein n=1 Tax=Arenibacter TaxID=178469 RepID=UPI000CD3AE2A|nr:MULTISPECIES: phosphocholine cytidylyltransferase family protein [Arenibacter]MCM4172241.1 phosphocholine cytidylyltransferase family protein [Arenibacter sp. TNZ]